MALDNAAVNSKLVVILVIIVGLIAAVGVIISAVALGRPSAPDISISTNNHPITADWLKGVLSEQAKEIGIGSGVTSKRDVYHMNKLYGAPTIEHQAKSVWTVALGYDNGAHDYRSEDGTVDGFGVDLVNAICAAVGIECRVVYDRYQNCWTSSTGHYPSGGQGLLGQWYDACIGWAPTRDRMNVFNFSPSYAKSPKSKIYVNRGDNQELSNIMQKSIGFVKGFVADEQCLTKGKKHLAQDNVVYVDTAGELVQLLKEGKVSAIFANDDIIMRHMKANQLMELSEEYECAKDGYAVMARKDSTFLPIWNEGFEKLKKSGAFKNLCNDAQKTHAAHGSILCNEG